MAEEEALIAEFFSVREKYLDLLARIAELKVPGVIEPLLAKCDVGESCVPGSIGLNPLRDEHTKLPPQK